MKKPLIKLIQRRKKEGLKMIPCDFCIPLVEGTLWLVQGIFYFEDSKGRQKKLGKIKLKEFKYGF